MTTPKIIGTILILLGLWIGYVGFNKISANTNKINILGIKIDASDEEGQTQGYIYLGLAAAVFVGGIYLVGKSGK